LIELFSSIQGEGVWIGCRQVFLRFAGCNLACDYCDTDYLPAPFWRAEATPGSGTFARQPNPARIEALLRLLDSWGAAAISSHHSLSLTGGEPLLQAETLRSWLPALRALLPLYLETNGTLPQALELLLPELDFISMDLKLPALSGAPFPAAEHRAFLALARRRAAQVKIVVAPEMPEEELVMAAELVQSTAPEVPLILQPLTREPPAAWAPGQLLRMHAVAACIHPPTRVIPQTHRYLDLL
jgi:organic radical activating enzyme